MRPSLPVGTILQNRYRVLSILGQGGFGRTYLAEDQGRFNERCALKELTPAQGGAYALDKSKELFQREAQILYQIQHPQIPQFRANFEQDQRLFLVQDYVEGQTYRALLDQRKAQGTAFSEAEVLQLLRQLLPVLAYVHGQGIIHRDIAPDNIILRQKDNKPVLIDFGVVKELATRFQTMTTGIVQPTTVGKPGYAPSEQMQTGKAYPSSDLYSLAVTAVVLLTGREPQELFDDATMTWYWQRWVTVNPNFAQVLNKMLSYRPGDRYQSAGEVLQALQAATNPTAAPSRPPVTPPAAPPPVAATPSPTPTQFSQVNTVPVGRRPAAELRPEPAPQRSAPQIIEPPRTSIWDDPLAIIATGLGLVILTGLGSWLIMRAILNNNASEPVLISTPSTPTPTPSPTFTPTPTPTPVPPPSPPAPVNYTKRLNNLVPGGSVSDRGVLQANETMTYIVAGQQTDTLEVVVSGDGVLMTLFGPDNRPIDDRSRRVSFWQGQLPYTGDYFIELRPVQGVDQGSFRIDVGLDRYNPVPPPNPPYPPNPPVPPPNPPTPPPNPQINEINVTVPPDNQSFSNRVRQNVINRYVVPVTAGRKLIAQVSGGAFLRVFGSDGRVVSDNGATFWQAVVTTDGDYRPGAYRIDVLGQRGTNYTLSLSQENVVF